ncbi:MAG: cyclic nucleotide-binding domain-containing protein [Deltaproteobacteria bacterium]|nr:cyclic nucleotide-binding domain-containing protein [Deltaproteobacteria bacterium]
MLTADPAWLARCALFGGLSQHACSQLARHLLRVDCKSGDTIYREGDGASALFLLESGRLEIYKQHNGREVALGELKSGEFFGDMSFIDMHPRSMTVCASEPAVIWKLDYAALREIYVSDLKCYTLVVMNIAREMSRRLRRADRARVIDRMSAQLFERATGARRVFGDVISRIGLRGMGRSSEDKAPALTKSRAVGS